MAHALRELAFHHTILALPYPYHCCHNYFKVVNCYKACPTMVSPIVAIKNGIRYCCTCDTKGRSPRSEFLWFWLFWLIVSYFIQNIPLSILSTNTDNLTVTFICALLLYAISVYGFTIILIRRFHDHNVTGYITVPLFLIICIDRFVGDIYLEVSRSLIGTPYTLEIPKLVTAIAMIFLFIGAISALAMIFVCLSKGTVGPNRYGPDPLAPKSETLADSTISDTTTTPQN